MQGHREFLARRAHGGAAPEVDDKAPRIVAMVLQVAADQFLGQLHPLRMGVARGDCAGVDGEEVSSRRQDIGAPPVGGASGSGGDLPAVQGSKQALGFAFTLSEDV